MDLNWNVKGLTRSAVGQTFGYQISEWPILHGGSHHVLTVMRHVDKAIRKYPFVSLGESLEKVAEYEAHSGGVN